jgi:hypothetical protein
MEIELKLLAAASVMGDQLCTRRAAACAAQAENDISGGDGERAGAACRGERHAWQG